MPARAFTAVVLILALVACGANQRRDTIRTTLVAFNAARDGFLEWDDRRQNEVTSAAEAGKLTTTEARKQLDAYRIAREPVEKAIVLAYRALAMAATQEDQLSLDAALAEAAKFYKALKALKGE